ncbi:MAG: LacI family DNA-binding transcriptional regulator [Clostridiales bacterium]|nr:LacI family DNA-binding transcriptional regulator [Clostridiales bacterium]
MESITIKDIARICGVGVSTVSRAMNNHPDVNKETKEKIMQAIEEYNYIPNNSARNLKRTEANTIAILVKGSNNPFFYMMIESFQFYSQDRDYSVLIHQVSDREDEIEIAMELVKEKRLKGIVFLGGYFSHTEDKFKKLPVPFVLATITPSEQVDIELYSHVSVDDVAESEKMVDYLCKKGHKKIAMLVAQKDDISISNLRVKGYKRALAKNEIELDEELIIYTEPDVPDPYNMDNGYTLAKKLLTSGKEFTAVFAISDRMAVGACKAFQESGIRIPEDVSVAGFDGLDIAHYYNPSLTTVRQPVEDMAEAAMRILFRLIDGEKEQEHCLFEGRLIEGESTKEVK